MNGFMIKAYDKLYKKGKNVDADKIAKKEKRNVVKTDIYDSVYFKKKPQSSKRLDNVFHPFMIDE